MVRTIQVATQGWKIRLLGKKFFELSDHLGNVTMTVSDRKQLGGSPGGYGAQVLSYEQYYPFGSTQEGRGANSVDYRYGFNGKEDDREWGSSLIQDYGFRLYNPGIARFLSVDPLAPDYPFYTPYKFAGNKPIQAIDLDGLEPYAKQLQTDYGMNMSFIIAHSTFIADGSRNGALGYFGKNPHRQAVLDYMWDVTAKNMYLWADRGEMYDQFYSAYNTYAIITEMDRQVEGFAEALFEKWAAARAESEEAGANVIRGMIETFKNRQAKWESLELAMEALDLAGGATAVKLMQQARRNRNRTKTSARTVKSSNCGCFTAGTIVKTKDGDKNIEEVEVGDWVWSYDDSTETVALKQVIQLHRYTRDTIYQLYVAGEIIKATGDHPFYTERSYTKARYLAVGDTLQLQNSGYSVVDSISMKLGTYTVYNFTVKDYHTYFVSSNGVLVHNDPCIFNTKTDIQDAIVDKDLRGATITTDAGEITIPSDWGRIKAGDKGVIYHAPDDKSNQIRMMKEAGSKVKEMKTYGNPYLRIEKRSSSGAKDIFRPDGTKIDPNTMDNTTFYQTSHHLIKQIEIK